MAVGLVRSAHQGFRIAVRPLSSPGIFFVSYTLASSFTALFKLSS